MNWLFRFLVLLSTVSVTQLNQVQTGPGYTKELSIKILALFSATRNDLGIDHRLGRQVLKLAENRARQLYPNVSVELIVQSDDTDCTSINLIPTRVAELFYTNSSNHCSSPSTSVNGTTTSICLEQSRVILEKGDENDDRLRVWGGVDAIIGPSCDFLVDLVARMAAYWQTPIYSATSIGAKFSQKDIYTTLTRLSPSVDQLAMFILRTLERFKWRHLALLLDIRQAEMELMARTLGRTFNRLRLEWPIERKLFTLSGESDYSSGNLTSSSSFAPRSQCTEETRNVLLGARKVARVFLLLQNDPILVRKLLLCAHELRMNNGEFVFLALQLGLRSASSDANDPLKPLNGSQHWKETERLTKRGALSGAGSRQNLDWYSVDDEQNNLFARQMFESLMVFSTELPTSEEYSLFVERVLDMAHQEYPEVRFERSSVSYVAAALHDSLLLAVEARQRLLGANFSSQTRNFEEDEDERLGIRRKVQVVPLMWNERFASGLIQNMHINADGDQELDYILSDLEPETGLMRPVASYSKQTRQVELLPGSYIHWPLRDAQLTSGRVGGSSRSEVDLSPPDEPECGFNGDADRCVDRQNLHAILLVAGILVLLGSLSVAFSHYQYRKIKYQQQLDDYCWRVNWGDLQFVQMSDSIASSTPGSVARALRAGASVVSVGTCEIGSVVSITMNKNKETKKTVEPTTSETNKQEAKLRPRKLSRPPPLILTSTPTVRQESDNDSSSVNLNVATSPTGNGTGNSQQQLSPNSARNNQSASCFLNSDCNSSVVRRSMLAMYRGELIIVKQLNGSCLDVTHELLVELRSMRELVHDNLARFVGLCVDPGRLSVVYEFCSRGSLQDILLNDSIVMDWTLKYSIIGDIVNGLNFIHTTLLGFHGRLKSTNLVLDSRFTVKLSDFGLQSVYSQLEATRRPAASDDDDDQYDDYEDQPRQPDETGRGDRRVELSSSRPKRQQDQLSLTVSQAAYNMESVSMRGENPRYGKSELGSIRNRRDQFPGTSRKSFGSTRVNTNRMDLRNRNSARYFWTAPEHLRDKNVHFASSKKGDIYALAIILFEIFTRREPYHYGTTAKPHWPTIRKDRAGLVVQSTTGSRRLASEVSHVGRSSISSNARRVVSKIKQAQPTVAPQVNRDLVEGLAETGSSVSSQPSNSDVEKKSEVATRNVVLSVHAIQEEDEQGVRPNPKAEVEDRQMETKLPGQSHIGTSSATTVLNRKTGQEGRTSELAPPGEQQSIDAEEILDQLRMGLQPEPVRPYVPNYVIHETTSKLIELMRLCWSEMASSRPSIQQVRSRLRKITKGVASKNYLDNLLDRLQNYAADLERIVDGKSSDIMEEKNRTEELLYQLVPKFVAYRLKRNEPIIPQLFEGVTIFFSDIIGFEKFASVMSPSELVDLLNSIYCSFESIISSFDVTKIETIIDQFLVASGISLQQDQQASGNINSSQLELASEQAGRAQEVNQEGTPKEPISRPIRGVFRRSNIIKDSLKRTSASMESKGLSRDWSLDSGGAQQAASLEQPNNLSSSARDSSLELNHYKRNSAEQIARMALCIRDLVKSGHFRQTLTGPQAASGDCGQISSSRQFVASCFNIRIGIHSGKVCAGIVGLKRPKYCLIGDTVNVASRMHTNSKANKIQISNDTKLLLEHVPGLTIEPRGKIEIKGKGQMETYWLESSY